MSEHKTDYMTMQQALMAIGEYVDDTQVARAAESKILKAYGAVTVRFRNTTMTLNNGKLVGTRLANFWRTEAGRLLAGGRTQRFRFRVNGQVRRSDYAIKVGDDVEILRPYRRRV